MMEGGERRREGNSVQVKTAAETSADALKDKSAQTPPGLDRLIYLVLRL